MASPAGAPNKEIDCLSPEAQRLAEARLAAKRAARAEAREIRMRELERQQKEQPSEYSNHLNSSSRASSRASSARASPVVEERPEKDFTEKGSRSMPGLSAATLASLGGTSSRRGSGDTSISMDTEASIREIKDSLVEAEEKYKKAMVSNAQLDNEKTNFMYQVDTLKDTLLELEEQLAEAQRMYEEKSREFEREKHAHSILQFQFAEVKEVLRQREEMLEKHGINLNSEIATNGEASNTLNNVEHQGPPEIVKEELSALQPAGDSTLGRANGMEVKREIVETVGKRETLQHAEQEQHKQNAGEESVDIEGWRPGESAEGREPFEHRATSPGPLASAGWEGQAQGQILGHTSALGSPEQAGSNKVADMPDGRARASPERSSHLQEVVGDLPGRVPMQDSGNASNTQKHGEKSVASQDREKQDLKTEVEKSCQESVPGMMPESEKIRSTISGGPVGNHMENEVVAKGTEAGGQVGTETSNPAAHSSDTMNPDRKCMADELDPGTESEFPIEEGAKETPGQSTEAASRSTPEQRGTTEPAQAQTHPRAPAPTSSPNRAHMESEADTEKNCQQAEALDPSQKKTKNKKKKNKKKKAPAPAEALQDARNPFTCQNPEAGETEEEGQVQCADQNEDTEEALKETTENPTQEIGVRSCDYVDCPENPEITLDGAANASRKGEEATAGGDELAFDDGAPSTFNEPATGQRHPAEAEKEIGKSRSLLENQGPSHDVDDAQHLDSICLDSDGLSASLEEPGDFDSEGRGGPRAGSERGRSKEDCTMS